MKKEEIVVGNYVGFLNKNTKEISAFEIKEIVGNVAILLNVLCPNDKFDIKFVELMNIENLLMIGYNNFTEAFNLEESIEIVMEMYKKLEFI